MQIAVFVDAGYLYAQGSTLLAGKKQPRNLVILNVEATLAALRQLCNEVALGQRLLRIYWYDGLPRSGRMSSEQEQVASAPYTKLRLGVINSNGEQKGVDSLIVTDIIDLARNRAVTSALVLSGDEDIRIGVQIAQTFGVQVHLLGIKPARGSQSPDLIQEADTHHEWTEDLVKSLISILEQDFDPEMDRKVVHANASAAVQASLPLDAVFDTAINDCLNTVDTRVLENAVAAFRANPSAVPSELDRPTLGRIRNTLGRDLTEVERKSYRTRFRAALAQH
jgi:uncharacterized LabA/DUF88 family protein